MKRNELIKAVGMVRPGAGESGMSGSNLLMFDDKGWIRSFSDKLSVSYKFETGIEGALPVEELYKALNKMKGENVEITVDETTVLFKCGRSRLKLIKATGVDLDSVNAKFTALNLDNVTWIPTPARLLDGLMLSLFSAEDSVIGKLTGVVISDTLILSTDNYRISMYDMKQEIGTEEIIRLKTSSVNDLVKMKNSFEFISSSDQWFHLKSKDNLIISVRQLPLTDYPLDEVIAVFSQIGPISETQVYELPEGLEESIDRAEIMAGMGEGELNFSTQISLRSVDGNLVVKGTKEVGELEDTIPWEGVIPFCYMSPSFLRKVLSITRSFKVNPAKDRALFESDNFKYLMVAQVE
jgi:hypothetical protein